MEYKEMKKQESRLRRACLKLEKFTGLKAYIDIDPKWIFYGDVSGWVKDKYYAVTFMFSCIDNKPSITLEDACEGVYSDIEDVLKPWADLITE